FGADAFDAMDNPKLRFVQTDAFRYLTRETRQAREPLDIVISEPSNPWVVGVENLFTRSYYDLVRGSMKPDGIFAQWLQLYEIDERILLSVMHNVTSVFPHARLYVIGKGDAAIIASKSPLSDARVARRFREPAIQA